MDIDLTNQEKLIQCELCGRLFSVDETRPDSHSDLLLCEECSAEKNSCGCSDD